MTAKFGPAICLVMVSFAGCDRLLTMVLLVLAVGLQGAVFRLDLLITRSDYVLIINHFYAAVS